jgi:hypothetical protein
VTGSATAATPRRAAPAAAFVLCLAYFLGTVCYVKTMIRERENRAYRLVSVGYHTAALAVAAWLNPLAGALFGWQLIRAWLLPGRPVRPVHVGLVELANSVLLLLCVVAG